MSPSPAQHQSPTPIHAGDNWFDGAFSSLVAQFWRAAVPPAETQAESLFLETMLGQRSDPGVHLLDIMCGSGRLARPMGRLGYRVTGIDLSQAMIDEALVDPLPDRVSLIRADMRSLSGEAVFDGAYCFGNSWGYIDHADTVDFLARLNRCLRAGARFVIETGAIAESLLPDFRPDIRMSIDGFRFRALNRYDTSTSILHTEFRVAKGSQQARFLGRQTVYTLGELNRMMADARFAPVGFYAAPDFRPYRLGAERLMAVYEKS